MIKIINSVKQVDKKNNNFDFLTKIFSIQCQFSEYKNANEKSKEQLKKIKQQKIKYDYLYGINPVLTALHAKSRSQFFELYVNENQQQSTNPRISNLIQTALQLGVNVKFMSPNKLEHFASKIKHFNNSKIQNVILKCLPKYYQQLQSAEHFLQIINKENNNERVPFIICLQGITDPQNLGAILRSCFYLGVNSVVVEDQQKCPLSAAVSKASAGALELMNVYSVKDMRTFLKQLKNSEKLEQEQGGNLQQNGTENAISKNQNFQILVTGVPNTNENEQEQQLQKENKNIEISQLKIDLDKYQGVCMVLGAEGAGVNKELYTIADKIIGIYPETYLPGDTSITFPNTMVDSLNVSAAAAIFIQNIQIQLNQKDKK